MTGDTLTPAQKAEIKQERNEVLRWIRHFWIGSHGDQREALKYHFLKERAAGQYWPEKWLLMHGRCVLVGNGNHLRTDLIKKLLAHVRGLGPFVWMEAQTPATLSAWGRFLDGDKLVKTVSDTTTGTLRYLPEAFDSETFVPSHLLVSDDAVYEAVLGHSA